MKYLFILLFISCYANPTTLSTVVFDKRIKNAVVMERFCAYIHDTVHVKPPLEVRLGFRKDTVMLSPRYGTRGYLYVVMIVNDTLRIVDSVKTKRPLIGWPPCP